jgi:hypothetical protein
MKDLFGLDAAPDTQRPAPRPVLRPDGQFACAICGAPAHFGFGVRLRADRLGRWACRDHVAEVKNMPANDPRNPCRDQI